MHWSYFPDKNLQCFLRVNEECGQKKFSTFIEFYQIKTPVGRWAARSQIWLQRNFSDYLYFRLFYLDLVLCCSFFPIHKLFLIWLGRFSILQKTSIHRRLNSWSQSPNWLQSMFILYKIFWWLIRGNIQYAEIHCIHWFSLFGAR